ncbi:methyl-accepting chemotaxis protein [Rheinheimera riviphila]|uniref:Methyl-accepting chemotaxis protein n=2 Tax=Rheinheimera riviphila TaxID=1834037 RepID=A0A437QF38_9GAMM|nr:methyl-accepting chemotaxis protein [Rheinheimera riviphila]
MLAFFVLIAACGATLTQGLHTLDVYQTEFEAFNRRFHRISDIKEIKTNVAVLHQLLLKDIAQRPENAQVAGQNSGLQTVPKMQGLLDENTLIMQRVQETQGNLPEVAVLIMQLQEARAAHQQFFQNEVLPLAGAGQQDARWSQVSATGSHLNDQLVQKVVALERLTERLMQQSKVQVEQEFAALKQRLFESSLWMVGIGILLAFLLSRHIGAPLARLALLAEQIGRGEIPKDVAVGLRRDEVGRLTIAFAAMSNYLRELVLDLNESTSVLAASGEEILAVTNQVATSTQETATAISEIVTTVAEVKQTATLSGTKSQEVMASAELTKQETQRGRTAVQETLTNMEQICQQMQSVADSIVRLGEQSQAIGEIVAAVGDLAEQSNLLGVNASIEAVKAGDAGKGFSVVAQEVKALADQSKQATAQVRSILGEVQRALTKTVLLAEQSSKTVESGFERARQAGQAIQTLSERIDENTGMAMHIAACSQQQKIGMDQIAQAMESIRQASQDNVLGARQVDVAARSLNQLGLKLQNIAKKFRV